MLACTALESENDTNKLPFRAFGDNLEVYSKTDKRYKPLFLAGINLGIGVPGTYAGELAASREQYDNWLQLIVDAGINNVRIYTLHYPHFYHALNEFNSNRVANDLNPIYVFQGIWLDEDVAHPDSTDLVTMTSDFQTTIAQVIDAVHGNITIDQRYGEAYGSFNADVSQWVMGYILAREIHPDEVAYTNSQNQDLIAFTGNSLSIDSGTPIEIWATQQMDFTIQYEKEKYDTQRPISFTSWPTLDPIDHPTESSLEDSESLDLANIDITKAPAGIFYSFHAYPYYPDFISEDSNYRTYTDAVGGNSYLGYLHDLKAHYSHRPLVIAEFGAPSSWGNIHSSYSGISHGGHTESEQGDHAARLLSNLYDANTAGGMLFALLDEWWKPTWLTNVFDFPFNRRAYWHNVLAPEQNYGVIAFDSEISEPVDLNNKNKSSWAGNKVTKISASHNAAYFYIDLKLNGNIDTSDVLTLGLDTYDDELGEHVIPGTDGNPIELQNGYEFMLKLQYNSENWNANFYVTKAYDLFGLWNNEHNPGVQKLQSVYSNKGDWTPLIWKTNYSDFPDPNTSDTFYGQASNNTYEIGKLKVALSNEYQTSTDALLINGDTIKIRIPWGLLQLTDPARLQVFHDDPDTTLTDSTDTTGIGVGVIFNNLLEDESERYIWQPWLTVAEMPTITERIKPSYNKYKAAIDALGL